VGASDDQDLRPRTVRAIAWSSAASLVTQVITFGSALVVTRLVAPADFGRFALVLTLVGVVGTLSDTGLGTALVQRSAVSATETSSAFLFQAAVGIAASSSLVLTAGWTARLLQDESIQGVTAALACTVAMQGVASIPRSLLVRALQMRTIALIDTSAALCGSAVTVAMALSGGGVWSLAWGLLAGTSIATTATLASSPWRPFTSFRWSAVRPLFGFAGNYYGFTIVNYLIRNGDNLLVGRFLGNVQLGYYSRAYALLLVPSRHLSTVIGGSLQVGLARMASDHERSRRVYLEACQHIAFVAMPVMLTIAILAPDFVPVVMGEQWTEAVPSVRLLALAGVVEPIATTCGWLYFAQGRADLMLKISLLFGPLFIGAIAFGVSLGSSTAVAGTYLIATSLVIPVLLSVAGSLIGLRLRDYARAIRPTLLSALSAGAGAWAVRYLLEQGGAPRLLRLLLGSLVGGAVFLGVAQRLDVPELTILRSLLGRLRKRVVR
jgi:O-antigen/teichoic acid export membrane protein